MSSLLFADLIANLRQAMTTEGIVKPEARAILLAMAHQESRSSSNREYATDLAATYNNVFGVKFTRNDIGKYDRKTFGANQFDKTLTVTYRVYRDLRHCVSVEFYNKFERPVLYEQCKEVCGNGWPQRAMAVPDWRAWCACIANIHCDENPKHTAEVLILFDKYLKEEQHA